jgi:D-alanyl-D-alanine carboxypeptidase (penicillin-binding protein 5/6)
MTMKLKTLLLPMLLTLSGLALAQVPSMPKPAEAGPMPVPAPPQLSGSSYVLMDFNSLELLVEHKPDERVEPASITKLMTSYVVFHELAKGDLSLDVRWW